MTNKKRLAADMKYHYTYRITNIKEGMYYYGVHSCDCLPKEDIGFKYWSSGKIEFVKHQKQKPEQYKYKVLKIFNTRVEAVEHEIKLHTKFNVGVNVKFYNGSIQTSTSFDRSGIKHTEETKNKLKNKKYTEEECLDRSLRAKGVNNSMYGKKHSEETKKKISDSKKGRKISAETKEKMSDGRRKGSNHPLYNKGHSEETKKKISDSKKGTIVSEETKKKISDNGKGKITNRSVSVSIYDSKGVKMFTFPTGFSRLLKEYNLPSSLETTLRNNNTLFESEKSKNMAKNRNQQQYIGWYARKN